jgi:hypothetical protein
VTARWLAPVAAAATALALVVPTWLLAAPSGAPSLADGPPARTLPTDALVPWDGSSPPPNLGPSVWCDGALGCRAFNADDFAITAWARTNLIEPHLAGTATPTVVPPVLTPVCTASATVTGLTALVTASCDRATTAVVDVAVYPLPPIQTVADAQRHNREVQLGPHPEALSFQLDALTVPGEYVVKLGVFSWSWGEVYGWNDDAARLSVAAPGAPTATATVVAASATASASSTTTTTPTTAPGTATPTPTPPPDSTATSTPPPTALPVCAAGELRDGLFFCTQVVGG